MSLFVQQVFNGLSVSAIYALIGIGITLVYGLTRLVNFAHGELVMVAACLTFWLAADGGFDFYTAALLAIAAVGVIGAVLERLVFRHTLTAPLNGFIASLGLILVLQGIALNLFGPETKSLAPPFAGVLHVGGASLAIQRLVVIAIALLVLAVFFALLRYSRHGVGLRAAAIDPEAAEWMGIPVRRLVTLTFVTGGVLAGVAGALDATLLPTNTLIGGPLVIKGFAVALLGGLGNVGGALFASLIVGLSETLFSGYVASEWTDAFAFAVIVAVLLLRPQGLFRGTEGATI